jgi:hypothetical protein
MLKPLLTADNCLSKEILMIYSSSNLNPFVQERSFEYSTTPNKEFTYEISLRTAAYTDWLKELQGAYRLTQALLQGQLMGHYQLLDFLIWPQGIFTRIALKDISSLSEFLKFLKEKSIPAGETTPAFWDDELQWIKLVPPENRTESTQSFLLKANELRRKINQSQGFSPSLFFFYRDSGLTE